MRDSGFFVHQALSQRLVEAMEARWEAHQVEEVMGARETEAVVTVRPSLGHLTPEISHSLIQCSGGSGGGDPRLPPALATILLAAGRTVESFPADFASALLSGKVTVEILKRFLEFEANFFAKFVWGIQGFRERLLADPSFPIKLAIECGIGVMSYLRE